MLLKLLEWWSATVEPVSPIVGAAVSVARYTRNAPRPPKPAPNWLPRLNEVFRDDLHIRRHLHKEPRVEFVEPPPLSDDVARRAAQLRQSLPTNDAVATFVETPSWADTPVLLRAYSTDYATVCALDELAKRPKLLSANTLLYCPETRELILHRRSQLSRDHADGLHTFGGALKSPRDGSRAHDHCSLIRTARRETDEEAGLSFDIAALPPLVVSRQGVEIQWCRS